MNVEQYLQENPIALDEYELMTYSEIRHLHSNDKARYIELLASEYGIEQAPENYSNALNYDKGGELDGLAREFARDILGLNY